LRRAGGCLVISGRLRGREAVWVLCMAAAWCQASWVTRDELLALLARLRCAPVGRARLRAPHKPLLLLWLFGRFAASGSTVTAYETLRSRSAR
jgi:hypothetical protein